MAKDSKAAIVEQRYELVPVADLKPHPKNPRKGAADAIDQSIAENGFYGAVVVQKATSLILAGRHRWERAQAAGIATLPVIWVDVDDQAALRILAADNRTSDLAGYDAQALAELLESVRVDGGGLEGTGFSAEAFDAICQQAGDAILAASVGANPQAEAEEPEPDKAEELLGKWHVELGQLWQIGPHRLFCGDATEARVVNRVMNGHEAHWMWTDPPYGVKYVGKTKDALTIQNDGAGDLDALLQAVFKHANAVMLPGAPFYVAHADKAVVQFRAAIEAAGWRIHQTLIWIKNSLVMGHCDYHYQHEPILYGWKKNESGHAWQGSMYADRPWFGARDKTTLLTFHRPSRSENHPTMKPVDLIRYCLEQSTQVGYIGFEPFAGSGSTMVAAHESSRICYAVEIEPKYCAVVLERMQKLGVEGKLAG